MKFFKHFADAHRGNFIQSLMREFGPSGVGAYWILVEMCAEKLEKKQDELYTEAHCSFTFDERLVRSSLRFSGVKVKRMLSICEGLGALSFTIVNNKININMPKLLECLDRDTKRARTTRVHTAPKRKKEEKEKEKEKELDKELCKNNFTAKDLFNLWNENCESLKKVQKLTPQRIKHVTASLKRNSTEDFWLMAIKKAASIFKDTPRGEWSFSFDNLINESKLTMLIDGSYDFIENKYNPKVSAYKLREDMVSEGNMDLYQKTMEKYHGNDS